MSRTPLPLGSQAANFAEKTTWAGAGYRHRPVRRQAGNPVKLHGVSTMTALTLAVDTDGMPLSTGFSSGDNAQPDWQQVQTLRVADVVMTILKARKAMPSATAAAVSRVRHGDGYQVFVSLLEGAVPADAGITHPGGVDEAIAIFVARELGADLTDAFGGKDVIILQ